MLQTIQPSFVDFERAPLSALSLTLPADLETPVSAYLKVSTAARAGGKDMGFLLESVERGEKMGRFSFIAAGVKNRIEISGNAATLIGPQTRRTEQIVDVDILKMVRETVLARAPASNDALPVVLGGAVGYLGYDLVRHFEHLPSTLSDKLGLPEGLLLVPETVLVFDHARRVISIVALVQESGTNRERYEEAVSRIEELRTALAQPLDYHPDDGELPGKEPLSNFTQFEYEQRVLKIKEHIAAGDIFQLVLSQRLSGETGAEPFQIYRALRLLNPSPYMFFLDFGDVKLIGSSPETQVELKGRRARLNPIAGTRPRGTSSEGDALLEADLLSNEKELAEHVMLVDLARNDLGRVAANGSVKVSEFKHVEHYSHVMHMVSSVEAELAEGIDCYGLFQATFPAGTVSGAPKVRAMELIEELEPSRRGPYAGAVGYFGANGDMDMCIAIRTIVMKGRAYHLQAGAGIVADSDPTAEYHETLAKLAVLRKALALAETGF